MMKAILLSASLALLGLASAPFVSAGSCNSGDVCCNTSSVNCSCYTTQTSEQGTERDCTDTASGFACVSSTGPVAQVQVGVDCSAGII